MSERPADLPIRKVDWPHAPPHLLGKHGTYFVTSRTYGNRRLFHDETRLNLLHDALLRHVKEGGWQMEAWAVFANHYHFVAQPAEMKGASLDLGIVVARLHKETASGLNALDEENGRKVWQNYRDTRLTFERSYLARLNYVHNNPVKHRLVTVAREYPWCSAAWFERTASEAWIKTVSSFKIDRLQIDDGD